MSPNDKSTSDGNNPKTTAPSNFFHQVATDTPNEKGKHVDDEEVVWEIPW